MQQVDINELVDQCNYLMENIPKIIGGEIAFIQIKYKYDELNLSKVKCNRLYYLNQEGESIKNHILPKSLEKLCCSNNKLKLLPNLPNSLKKLSCWNNQLTSLPDLPNSLQELRCHSNRITSLPDLPNSLEKLYCKYNNLTSLPELPSSLKELHVGIVNLDKIEYNSDYKNVKFNLICSEITIGDYIIKSKEDYISYMEDYEKYLFSKVKSARK